MKYSDAIVGHRVLITENCSIKGWEGNITKLFYDTENEQERIYCDWFVNGNYNSNGWMPPHSLTSLSKFRQGDTIEVNGIQLSVDNKIKFDESNAVLIARKKLI